MPQRTQLLQAHQLDLRNANGPRAIDQTHVGLELSVRNCGPLVLLALKVLKVASALWEGLTPEDRALLTVPVPASFSPSSMAIRVSDWQIRGMEQ